jgi:hypothetical protein
LSPRGSHRTPGLLGRGFASRERLLRKLSCIHLLAALRGISGVIRADVRSAELEGALQYPPPSVGEDAQPPPARVVPQTVSPRRIELGTSGVKPAAQEAANFRSPARPVAPPRNMMRRSKTPT